MPSTDCVADIHSQEGDLVCADCVPDAHVRCSGCDQWHRTDSPCDNCACCDLCHRVVWQTECLETVRGSTICEDCRDNWYWRCPSCDGWNRDGYDCGNGCCPESCDCEDCHDDYDDGLIHSHDYKPRPVFHGTGPLYLGPEIEVETPYYRDYDCAKIADSHLGELGYLKCDSSIGNGFEIVTHPMSYDWALANCPWRMLDALREAGCAATASTGIHVHLSRAGFDSPCHVYRWMVFIYRNEHQVTTVARRCSDEWAAFTEQDRRSAKHYAKGARGDRYRAINTGNRDTFELRVFASSLDPAEVKAAFAFAAASVEYTRTLSVAAIAGGGWTWSAFVTWLADRPAYRPLSDQLEALQCVC